MKFNQKILKFRLVMLFITFNLISYAQLNFYKVDSISYELYKNNKWKELVVFGDQISQTSFDYYLLNLRVGIANYNIKKFNNAISFFKKANTNNSATSLPKEYLYWSYWYLKNNKKANYYYNQLDKTTRQKINKIQMPKKKLVDFIYLEGGINFQEDSSNSIGNVTYLNIGVSANISSNLSFYQAYYYQKQALSGRIYQMHRYYAKPKFKYKNFDIYLMFNYLQNNTDINSLANYSQVSTEENVLLNDGLYYDRIKTINQQNLTLGTNVISEQYYNIHILKLYSKFKVGVFGGVTITNNSTNVANEINGIENVVLIYEGNEVFNNDLNKNVTNTTETIYNYGVDFGIDITNKIGFASEINVINASSISTLNYVITTTYKLNDKFNFMMNYISKNKLPFYYYDAAYLINNKRKTQRLGFVSDIKLTKKLNLFFVYQHDIVTDDYLNKYINSNTLITGLKIQL